MKLRHLVVFTAVASFAFAPIYAQNSQGPLPPPTPTTQEPPLQPGGTVDTATKSRLGKIGSIVGIDGGLFVLTALGLVAISNNNDVSAPSTTSTSTTSTTST